MKRLVLCFDGTWNKPADDSLAEGGVETNVPRFQKSVHKFGADGALQQTFYNAGVGTEWYNKVTGGALGMGLDNHILDGYRYLVKNYIDGDEIYIVGFSRGAYTARSLVGLLRNCGLVTPQFGEAKILTAYGIYRARQDPVDSSTAAAFRKLFSRSVRVRFLGVWDTVGALGIPLQWASKLDTALYAFHDTTLSSIVDNACHAMALDEHRVDYDVCLWNPATAPQQSLQQRWFCGAHCDVGGGYPDRRLSDLALRWMQDQAAAAGLGLDPVAVGPGNLQGAVTDSYGQFLNGEYAKFKPPHLRKVLSTPFGNEGVDASIARRRSAGLAPPYAPTNPGLPPVLP